MLEKARIGGHARHRRLTTTILATYGGSGVISGGDKLPVDKVERETPKNTGGAS